MTRRPGKKKKGGVEKFVRMGQAHAVITRNLPGVSVVDADTMRTVLCNPNAHSGVYAYVQCMRDDPIVGRFFVELSTLGKRAVLYPMSYLSSLSPHRNKQKVCLVKYESDTAKFIVVPFRHLSWSGIRSWCQRSNLTDEDIECPVCMDNVPSRLGKEVSIMCSQCYTSICSTCLGVGGVCPLCRGVMFRDVPEVSLLSPAEAWSSVWKIPSTHPDIMAKIKSRHDHFLVVDI